MANKCNCCGLCCKLFLINLSETEYKSGNYKTFFQEFGIIENFTKAKRIGANLLSQKSDSGCIYLKGNSCEIYDFRPQVCRNFFCTSKSNKFKDMIKIIAAGRERKRLFCERNKDLSPPAGGSTEPCFSPPTGGSKYLAR